MKTNPPVFTTAILSFSVGPQRPATMATYNRPAAPAGFSLHGFVAGLTIGLIVDAIVRVLL